MNLTQAHVDAVNKFAFAKPLEKERQVLEENKDLLLTDEAEYVLRELLQQHKDDDKVISRLSDNLTAIIFCRRDGIEKTYESIALLHSVKGKGDDAMRQLFKVHPHAGHFLAMTSRIPMDLSGTLHEKLWSWLSTSDWTQSKEYIEQHPELLTDESEAELKNIIEEARRQKRRQLPIIEDHLKMLRQCRQKGIEAVYKRKVKRSPVPVSDIFTELPLDIVMRIQNIESQADVNRLIEDHPEVLPYIEEIAERSLKMQDPLKRTIWEWVGEQNTRKSKQILKKNPELLSKKAETMLNELLATAHESNEDDQIVLFENHLFLQAQCRKHGIERGYEELARRKSGYSSYKDKDGSSHRRN